MIAHVTHVAGVDPGLEDTGLVDLMFVPEAKEISVQHAVVKGLDGPACRAQLASWGCYAGPFKADIWIEGYRPRSNLNTDQRMVSGVQTIRSCTKGKVLNNTGILQVIPTSVMLALGVWKFNTPTHHQDLRSAARIAVLGMLKDPDQNRLIADVIRDHIDGHSWSVTTS